MPPLLISLWSAKYRLGSQEAGGPPGHPMWLLTCVWESRRYLLPAGCFRGGSHGLFQKVLLTLSPRFSPYACDKSHSPGVHVLVDTVAAIKSFLFLIRAKRCHQQTHENSNTAGYTIPYSFGLTAFPKEQISPVVLDSQKSEEYRPVSQEVLILAEEWLKSNLHRSRHCQFWEIPGSEEFAIFLGA